MGQPFTVQEMKDFGLKDYDIDKIYSLHSFICTTTCVIGIYLLFYCLQ